MATNAGRGQLFIPYKDPVFQYGKGPLRDALRSLGDTMRSEVVGQAGGLLNNFTGWREQANLEETWTREDTAIQRMTADAEAAGINPMALVGSGMGAPTSSPGDTQGNQDAVAAAASLAQFDKRLEMMDAQINQINAATDRTIAETEFVRGPKTGLTVSQIGEIGSRVKVNSARVREIFAGITETESRVLLQTAQRRATEANIRLIDANASLRQWEEAYLKRGISYRDAQILAVESHIALEEAQAEYSRVQAQGRQAQIDWMEKHGLPPDVSLPTEFLLAFLVHDALFGNDGVVGKGARAVPGVRGGELTSIEQLFKDAGIEIPEDAPSLSEDEEGHLILEGYEYSEEEKEKWPWLR